MVASRAFVGFCRSAHTMRTRIWTEEDFAGQARRSLLTSHNSGSACILRLRIEDRYIEVCFQVKDLTSMSEGTVICQ